MQSAIPLCILAVAMAIVSNPEAQYLFTVTPGTSVTFNPINEIKRATFNPYHHIVNACFVKIGQLIHHKLNGFCSQFVGALKSKYSFWSFANGCPVCFYYICCFHFSILNFEL
jgi:hypothetical protein